MSDIVTTKIKGWTFFRCGVDGLHRQTLDQYASTGKWIWSHWPRLFKIWPQNV